MAFTDGFINIFHIKDLLMCDNLSKNELIDLMLNSIIGNEISVQAIENIGKNILDLNFEDIIGCLEIEPERAVYIASSIALARRIIKEYHLMPNSQIYDNNYNIKIGVSQVRQRTLFDSRMAHKEIEKNKDPSTESCYFNFGITGIKTFKLQNRRYLGNKFKLLGFIEDIVSDKCNEYDSFCDLFAGTGVVGERFNKENIKIISNDFLNSNFVCIDTFLGTKTNLYQLPKKIDYLNNINTKEDNYFSENFGNTYFTLSNARKIGHIREKIEEISETGPEKNALICSLIYAVDKVANTVGHYDAFRKKLDSLQTIKMLVPEVRFYNNRKNEIYKENANILIKRISCDVLYIDPPYNSRQYSDAYHLLENLAEWKKEPVRGKAKKIDRSHIKSDYCLKTASSAFGDLILNADCKHILLSYNNTGNTKDGRSNARICDEFIIDILKRKGDVEVFEKQYKAFNTGKSISGGNIERVFYCQVKQK